MFMQSYEKRPHVVIIGAGFAGIEAARGLEGAPVQITLLDRQNYHLFQPLLYQVATASLSPDDIVSPVRGILRKQHNLEFRQSEVKNIDLCNHRIITNQEELIYDYLIVAPGGDTNFFGLDSVAQHGFGLKKMDDAVSIRNHVLRKFELAVQEQDADKRQAMLTFIVVGGGPTGVELAGALSELSYTVLAKDYPQLSSEDVCIMLFEASNTLLPSMPENLRDVTAETLRKKKVNVQFGASVTDFDGQKVILKSGQTIPAETLVWAAGVRATELIDTMGVKQGSLSRAIVSSTLQLDGYPEVFVVGDAAHIEDKGRPLPMIALVALQTGSKAAANIKRLLCGQEPQKFVFRDLGSLAIIGRHAAVGKVGGLKIKGLIAWLIWIFIHIIRLVSPRNRFFVFWTWLWDYIFYDRSMRLITRE